MEILNIHSPIEIAGLNDDKPYIEMTTRLCWLDAANLNGVGLSSTAEDSFKTLVGMPVVAKINSAGTQFGSHEVSIDDKGEIKFNTSAYGVHTDVWVAEDEVDLPSVGLTKMPCLFAKSKIWKRFSSVVELIANKLENPEEFNGGLWSSWELQGSEYHINESNEKIYDKFSFMSNCLIDVPPAYSTASKTLFVASKAFENELSNAYLDDLSNSKDFERSSRALNINNILEMKEKEENLVGKEVSALTTRDLHQKIYESLNPKGWNSNPYYSIWEVYPEDHKVLAYDIDRESEDDYLVFTYSINDDVVTVGDSTSTKLSKILSEKTNVNISLDLNDTAKILSEKDTEIKELSSRLSTKEAELSEKVDALLAASETISQLQASVEELTPFKVQVEEIQQAELEKETAEKKEELKKIAVKGGYISSEELDTSEELKALVDALDEKGIKAVIAERFIKKLDEQQPQNNPVEVSETKKQESIKTNIDNDDEAIDHKVVMSSFLKN